MWATSLTVYLVSLSAFLPQALCFAKYCRYISSSSLPPDPAPPPEPPPPPPPPPPEVLIAARCTAAGLGGRAAGMVTGRVRNTAGDAGTTGSRRDWMGGGAGGRARRCGGGPVAPGHRRAGGAGVGRTDGHGMAGGCGFLGLLIGTSSVPYLSLFARSPATMALQGEKPTMPIYEYRCQDCGNRFERLQRLGQGGEGLSCPECGE